MKDPPPFTQGGLHFSQKMQKLLLGGFLKTALLVCPHLTTFTAGKESRPPPIPPPVANHAERRACHRHRSSTPSLGNGATSTGFGLNRTTPLPDWTRS